MRHVETGPKLRTWAWCPWWPRKQRGCGPEHASCCAQVHCGCCQCALPCSRSAACLLLHAEWCNLGGAGVADGGKRANAQRAARRPLLQIRHRGAALCSRLLRSIKHAVRSGQQCYIVAPWCGSPYSSFDLAETQDQAQVLARLLQVRKSTCCSLFFLLCTKVDHRGMSYCVFIQVTPYAFASAPASSLDICPLVKVLFHHM